MPKTLARSRRYGMFPRGTIQVARGALSAYRAARRIQSVWRNRFKKHGSYGKGVTNQYDRTNVYRKKRMPYRKRKRWSKFIKKVRAAENVTLGTRTRVFNSRILVTSTQIVNNQPRQLFRSVCLYGNHDETSVNPQLGKVRNDIRQLTVDDPDISNSGSIQMISGIFDMTLVNASIDALNNPMGIELDVYLVTASKRFEVKTGGTVGSGSLESMFVNAIDTSDQIGSRSKLNTHDLGVTPFDVSLALSMCKIKILSKKKYFLPSGNQMTYQIRDPRNRLISKEISDNINGTNYPGVTKHLLLVAKGLPGAATVPTEGTNPYAVRLEIGLTRKYAYKVNEADQDETGYN